MFHAKVIGHINLEDRVLSKKERALRDRRILKETQRAFDEVKFSLVDLIQG